MDAVCPLPARVLPRAPRLLPRYTEDCLLSTVELRWSHTSYSLCANICFDLVMLWRVLEQSLGCVPQRRVRKLTEI